jgi:hypothetical protein
MKRDRIVVTYHLGSTTARAVRGDCIPKSPLLEENLKVTVAVVEVRLKQK